MQSKEFLESTRKIARMILNSPQKMIREKDIKSLCPDFNFDDLIAEVYNNLKNIGLELIKSNFLDETYYILTTEGKDDTISAVQYGILALILAITKEVNENLNLSDIQKIFGELWTSDVKSLIEKDYLREIEDLGIIKVTPLGKAIFKEILPELDLKNILGFLKEKEKI